MLTLRQQWSQLQDVSGHEGGIQALWRSALFRVSFPYLYGCWVFVFIIYNYEEKLQYGEPLQLRLPGRWGIPSICFPNWAAWLGRCGWGVCIRWSCTYQQQLTRKKERYLFSIAIYVCTHIKGGFWVCPSPKPHKSFLIVISVCKRIYRGLWMCQLLHAG